jgi:peptide-methionine (S)-S-oxide reductase
MSQQNKMEVATLGGGCFWCVEAVFQELQGVKSAISGYAGGKVHNPTYRQVCEGDTDHAEVVQITFDPEVVSFKEVLYVFFTVHDPTTLNRQGADVGTQYRSVIFYHDDKQKQIAQEVIKEFTDEKVWDDPIVTELSPAPTFYPAEGYHQEYLKNNPFQPYCVAVVMPKVAKFRKYFKDKLKKG